MNTKTFVAAAVSAIAALAALAALKKFAPSIHKMVV